MTATGGSPQLSRRRRRQRYWASVLSVVVVAAIMFVVVPMCLAVAVIAAGGLWPSLVGGDALNIAVPVGLLVGLGALTFATYRAPVWLHRIRLWRLRRSGASAVAEVVWIAGDSINPTMFEGYVVFVRWRDLGGEHVGDRCYRFWDGAPYDFLSRFEPNRTVVVRYPTARPHRFVIDVPYAPTIADHFI